MGNTSPAAAIPRLIKSQGTASRNMPARPPLTQPAAASNPEIAVEDPAMMEGAFICVS